MTKEQAIEILKYNSNVIHQTINGETDTNEVEALDMAIKALEIVEEFEKAQIITGGRLNGRTYAYKCGLEDGKRKALEQQPSEDCVSRQAVFETIDDCNSDGLKGIFCSYDDGERFKEYIKKLPPVTPTHHKSATNGEEIIRAFPNLKYTIQNGRVVTTIGVASSFDLDWWNAPYKKGNENDTKTSNKGI